jgi:Na+/phosphate symporter
VIKMPLAIFFLSNAFRRPDARMQSQIVRPLESIAETQPQLQPALLRLSAMISRVLHAGCFYLELIADAGRINSPPA